MTDSGNLNIFDARKPNEVCASQRVHTASVNDVKVSKNNLAFTCSEDQYVRAWNLLDLSAPIAAKNPKCVTIVIDFRVNSSVWILWNLMMDLFCLWAIKKENSLFGKLLKTNKYRTSLRITEPLYLNLCIFNILSEV